MTTIGRSFDGSGMGDVLLLTSVCKHMKCKVQLHPDYKRFSRFFRDIAELELTEQPTKTSGKGSGLYVEQLFRGLGIQSNDFLPYVSISEQEKIVVDNLKKCFGAL